MVLAMKFHNNFCTSFHLVECQKMMHCKQHVDKGMHYNFKKLQQEYIAFDFITYH